jgi:hypothetical protein
MALFQFFYYDCASHSRRRSFHCIYFFPSIPEPRVTIGLGGLFLCTKASFAANSRVSTRGGVGVGRVPLNILAFF